MLSGGQCVNSRLGVASRPDRFARTRVGCRRLAARGRCRLLQHPHDRREPAPRAGRVRQGALDRPAAALPAADRRRRRPGAATACGLRPIRAPKAAATRGSDVSPASTGAQPATNGEGYELNFENTPVTGVAKVVLGDILGARLPDRSARAGHRHARVRPAGAEGATCCSCWKARCASPALRWCATSAATSSFPPAEAVGTGSIDAAERGRAGLRHHGRSAAICLGRDARASCSTASPLKPGTVRVDTARNLVLVQGSGPERRNAIETVLSFDADWMRGQSVGIYPVRNSTPEPIITELERIMDSGEGGLSQSLVKLQPIARLNAIMVVTTKPALLRTTATWITRLDKSDTASTGVKVYQVRYGDARQMAGAAQRHLRRRPRGGGAIDSATNQIAPGAGVATSTSEAIQQSAACASPAHARSRAGRRRTRGISGATTSPAIAAQAGGAADIVRVAQRPFGRGGAAGGFGASGGTGLGSGTGGGGGQAILPNVRITADAVNNTLLIYANQEQLPPDRADAEAARPAAASGLDRRDHRGDHAQREPELRRAVLPQEQRRRLLGRQGLGGAEPRRQRDPQPRASGLQLPARTREPSRASCSMRCAACPT